MLKNGFIYNEYKLSVLFHKEILSKICSELNKIVNFAPLLLKALIIFYL